MAQPIAFISFLFDNGSLRPASTLHLRQIAAALNAPHDAGDNIPEVVAVSLLHSNKVAPAELGGSPTMLLEEAVRRFWEANPTGVALVVPAFFGPSQALTGYVPKRLSALAARFPQARWEMAPSLVNLPEESGIEPHPVTLALAEETQRVMMAASLEKSRPKVLLVDHGSPEIAVTAVREFLGGQLQSLLGDEVAIIGTACMERRPEACYDFNDPLLERALRTPPFNEGDVVLALQFLSPGRHAGEGGDIAGICEAAIAEARAQGRSLRIWRTEPIGAHPHVVGVLRERLKRLVADAR